MEDKLIAEYEAIVKQQEEILAESDEDGKISEEAAERFAELERRATELAEAVERLRKVRERREALEPVAKPEPDSPRIEVGKEERTYRPDGEHSFVRDAYLAEVRGDPGARERIERHRRECAEEYRDVGTGAFAGLVVPQYLIDQYAPRARAGRPFADSVRRLPLPDAGMTVNISRITTGSAVAAQASENAAVAETDMDDTVLTVNVRTYAGQQDVSRQAIERGTLVEDVVVADLVADYHSKLDAAILVGDGTAGTHVGVLNTAGTHSVTYTDSSPTVPELWPKLADAIQRVNSAFFGRADLIVMHPRRWGWVQAALDTTNRPLAGAISGAPANVVGTVQEPGAYGQPVGLLQGLPVITDANVPTNLGGGTEDAIIVCNSQEIILWEQTASPLQLRFEDVGAGSLTVKFVVFGYSAFTAGRQPQATAIITGTGLAAPTF